MRFKIYFTAFIFPFHFASLSQTFTWKNTGLNIGAHLAAGTHFNRIGFSCNAFFVRKNFQLNPGFKFYYNSRNIGPSEKYIEFVPSLGFLFSFGKTDSTKNYFTDILTNQTLKRNSFGYCFNYYINHIHTSQPTGTFTLGLGNFQFIGEDDVFAGGIRDEFRTGSFLDQYRQGNFRYGINFFTGWTGKRGIHTDDPNYPSRNGYMDMSHSLYGNVSAGLLSAQVQYTNHSGQLYQANAGIDAEQVRNFVQNKMVHRFFFSPKKDKWRGGSDLPMLDTKGNMYLYKKDQKIRPARLYVNLFLNPSLFY
jgi:hypothetical protein